MREVVSNSDITTPQSMSIHIPNSIKKQYLLGILSECMEKSRQADHCTFGKFENEFNYLQDTSADKYFPIYRTEFERYINYLNAPLQMEQGVLL